MTSSWKQLQLKPFQNLAGMTTAAIIFAPSETEKRFAVVMRATSLLEIVALASKTLRQQHHLLNWLENPNALRVMWRMIWATAKTLMNARHIRTHAASWKDVWILTVHISAIWRMTARLDSSLMMTLNSVKVKFEFRTLNKSWNI